MMKERNKDPLGRDIPAHLRPKKTTSKFPFSYQKYEEESAKSLFTKIEENFKVTSWSKKNFEYSEVKTQFLDSILLKDNEQFLELVSYIVEFNDEVARFKATGKKIRNGPWRQSFYLRLQSLLLETIYTREQEIQAKFMNKVYEWAHDQMARNDNDDVNAETRPISAFTMTTQDQKSGKARPFSSLTKTTTSNNKGGIVSNELPSISAKGRPLSSVQPKKDIRPVSGKRPFSSKPIRPLSALVQSQPPIEEEPIAVDEEISESESKIEKVEEVVEEPESKTVAPSKLREEMLRDYAAGHRTAHHDFDAPYQRLKLYTRKQLIPEEKPLHQEDEMISIKEIISSKQETKRQNDAEAEEEEIEQEQPIEQEPMGLTKKEVPKKKKKKGKKKKKIDPIHLKGISLQPMNKAFIHEADLDNPAKLDHFDPLSDYIAYAPTNTIKEKQIEARFLKEKQKELKDKREDEEFCDHIQKWAKAKSTLEADQTRKVSQKLLASNFESLAFKKEKIKNQKENKKKEIMVLEVEEDDGDDVDSQFDEPIEKQPQIMEFDASDMVINANIQTYDKEANRIFGVQDLEKKQKERNIPEARRIYSAVIPKSSSESNDTVIKRPSLSIYSKPSSVTRPFSAINMGAARTTSTNAEVGEIDAIKNRLAQDKICVDYKTLTNALVVPLGFKNPEVFELPRPGSALMSNPFSKIGAKKKKKGKKKGKKGKR